MMPRRGMSPQERSRLQKNEYERDEWIGRKQANLPRYDSCSASRRRTERLLVDLRAEAIVEVI